MNKILTLTLLACACLVLTACATFEKTSAKMLVSTTQTVDSVMKGWAAYAVAARLTDAQQAPVKAAYVKYQACELAAENAYFAAVASGDKTSWEVAKATLESAFADLQTVVAAITAKRVENP